MISFIHTVWERSLMQFYNQAVNQNPSDNYLFKVNNRNVKTMREVYSKLAIKTLDIYIVTYCSGISTVDFKQVNSGWEYPNKIFIYTMLRGVFKTQPNAFDRAFCEKQCLVVKYFSRKAQLQIFHWVLNTALKLVFNFRYFYKV